MTDRPAPHREDRRVPREAPSLRVGQAAEMLQVSVETLRRWETDGRLGMTRSGGGQRLVPISEVTRLLAEKRATGVDRPIVSGSARNRFPGIVTRIEKDRIAAVDEMGLQVGDEAVCVVKATNVIVEVPTRREPR